MEVMGGRADELVPGGAAGIDNGVDGIPDGEAEVVLAEGARRREAIRRDIEERLAGDAALARFRKFAEPLAHYIPIREARAYWQLALTGIFRGLLLRDGSYF